MLAVVNHGTRDDKLQVALQEELSEVFRPSTWVLSELGSSLTIRYGPDKNIRVCRSGATRRDHRTESSGVVA